MKGRRLSEEERRQREKEERSRQRIMDQAYREAERAVYARIYQDEYDYPQDYREPRDRVYEERPRRTRPLDSDTIPRRQPMEDTILHRPEAPIPQSEPVRQPPPTNRRPEDIPPVKTKKGKKRKIALIVLMVLAFLLVLGMALHILFVRAPDLDKAESQGEGTHPALLEAGRREDVYTFLLVGRDDAGGGNTDTIMVGCYDVPNGTLDVLSIYRDTLVDVPWEIKKINSVYNNTGMEGLLEEVRDLIGYIPDYYFVMEMDIVAQLVDAMGGVDYDVPYDMHYDDPTQDLHIHYDAGMQHLTGEDAVKVLRWRQNNSGPKLSVGDVGRVEVQQSFMKAMIGQALSFSTLTNIKEIAEIVDTNLDSNLTYGEMVWFGEHALFLQEDGTRFHSLPGDYTGTLWSQTYQNYQSYVFVNDGALLDIINNHMNPYTT
ncbi:MAG: LCP family protein, partial [Ruminiclostridium sp.]|nr:LCP family protein [Ruminiclostridium sp.]